MVGVTVLGPDPNCPPASHATQVTDRFDLPRVVVVPESYHFRCYASTEWLGAAVPWAIEVGSSTGCATRLLLKSGCRKVVGLEVSKELLRRCREEIVDDRVDFREVDVMKPANQGILGEIAREYKDE